jgi:hypothetical protein
LIRNARLDAKIDSEKVQLSISRWLEVFVWKAFLFTRRGQV